MYETTYKNGEPENLVVMTTMEDYLCSISHCQQKMTYNDAEPENLVVMTTAEDFR
jgi:hypothetical protein